MRQCAHPDCQRQIKDEIFACKQHWFGLPEPIRRVIWDRWIRYENEGGDIALSNLRLAHEAAFSWWRSVNVADRLTQLVDRMEGDEKKNGHT